MRTTTTTTLLLLLPLTAYATPFPKTTTTEAPLHTPHERAQILDDHYIVVLKKEVGLQGVQGHLMMIEEKSGEDPLQTLTLINGNLTPDSTGGIRRVYVPSEGGRGYYGYAGSFTPETLAHIRSSPEVSYVEHDQIISLDYLTPSQVAASADSTASTYYPKLPLNLLPTEDLSPTPDIIHSLSSPWGLSRISHRPALTLGTLQRYGVAKGANIIAVKVLGDNGSGTLSDVIGGIEWAVSAAEAKQKKAGKNYRGSVISMSLGGGKSQSTDDAVNAAVDAGVIVVVAAGNDNRDCDNSSPARAKKVITVGATTLGDERAYFSNFGAGININAPGLNILSIWTGGNNTANTISGTSMACPHVAGYAAYMLEIYGTETFPLMSQKDLNALTILAGEEPSAEEHARAEAEMNPTASSGSSFYSLLYNSLPFGAKSFLPTPKAYGFLTESMMVAPVPKVPEVLTPAQIKGLITKLASKNILTNLPEGTPNVLLYNNATSA